MVPPPTHPAIPTHTAPLRHAQTGRLPPGALVPRRGLHVTRRIHAPRRRLRNALHNRRDPMQGGLGRGAGGRGGGEGRKPCIACVGGGHQTSTYVVGVRSWELVCVFLKGIIPHTSLPPLPSLPSGSDSDHQPHDLGQACRSRGHRTTGNMVRRALVSGVEMYGRKMRSPLSGHCEV